MMRYMRVTKIENLKKKTARKSKTMDIKNPFIYSIGMSNRNKIKIKVEYRDISPAKELIEPPSNSLNRNLELAISCST